MSDLENKIIEKQNLLYDIFKAIKKRNKGEIKWGDIQNDKKDNILNIYEIKTFHEFIEKINALKNKFDSDEEWKKWCEYITMRLKTKTFSAIDEYIFAKYGAIPNPQKKSKDWDFICHNIKFDLKSSKVFHDDYEILDNIVNEKFEEIDFQELGIKYYKEQSKEKRYSLNNRLFLLHVTKRRNYNISSDDLIRLNFKEKEKAIKYFMELGTPIIHNATIDGKDVQFAFLIIYENNEGIIKHINA